MENAPAGKDESVSKRDLRSFGRQPGSAWTRSERNVVVHVATSATCACRRDAPLAASAAH